MSFLQDIFGGSSQNSQSTSSSSNQAYPWLMSNFGSGSASAFNQGTNALAGLLGLGPGGDQGFKNYTNSDGYNFLLDSGSRAISGNMATKGLLNSGATLKAEQEFGQNLGATQLQNYIGDVSDLAKLGLGGGSLISGAGNVFNSNSTGSGSSSGGGLGSFLGSVMSVIPFL